jgi:hypothetical protein
MIDLVITACVAASWFVCGWCWCDMLTKGDKK